MANEIEKILEHFDEGCKRRRRRDQRYAKLHKRTRKKPGKISLLTVPSQRAFNEELESYKKRSESFSKGVSKRIKGSKLSDVHKFRISRSLKAKWILISPTGKEQIVTDLKRFCKRNNLNYKCMSAVNVKWYS